LLNIFSLLAQNTNELATQFNVTANKQQEYTEKFMYICEYIRQHCSEDLCLDDIAALAGFSKYHFSRLFKQFTGVSFYKFLNQKRIALAEKQLSDANNSITEVAINSGFSSMSSFIRMFKQIKNCTPTEFRNMHNGTLRNI
jgi:AraC-like DNA-binding protein